VFLDTSVLFAGVHSESGGSRLILKLGEAGAVSLWVGPWVLREADEVLGRKSTKSKALFALLLDWAQIQVGEEGSKDKLEQALLVVDYLPDAQVLAEALMIRVDYFVTFDRKHLPDNRQAGHLPFLIGTAGEFLGWYRERLTEQG
jgi:predicted nucleic acid-binding protein